MSDVEAETSLWIAVLRLAAFDANKKRSGRHAGVQQEALQWFFSENRRPRSFRWVCELLPGGGDPARLRERFLREFQKQPDGDSPVLRCLLNVA